MHLVLAMLALQLDAAAPAPPQSADLVRHSPADSARDARRAHDAQILFERARRTLLPVGYGSGGHCDVRIGRFCWWDDGGAVELPPEREEIGRRRTELLRQLDALGAKYPGDEWVAGMRVHYRVEGHGYASADSVARSCRSASWWCFALRGYVAHVLGDASRADSAFSDALASMSSADRCAWQDIAPLLPGDARGRYEKLDCERRAPLETRYWLLSRPRLAASANEWRNEYASRRVQNWLAERASTPQGLSWGKDASELLLRYGWPVAWSRIEAPMATLGAAPSIVGHDPSPSFQFSPREELLDSLVTGGEEWWEPSTHQPSSRYAPHALRRLVSASAQTARFRRGDSTLLVAAWTARDDSLAEPHAALAASLADGRTFAAPADSSATGRGMLLLPAQPLVAGVEIADTARATLAWSRSTWEAGVAAPGGLSLSDLLVYRPGEEPAASLDSALARAIPGDTASRSRAIGLFWETYGPGDGDSLDVAVTVERVDRSFLRTARQRMGLAEPDSPLRMRWSDARPGAGGIAPHAISLDLGNLPEGRYRLTLSLVPAGGGVAASTAREVRLLER